EFIECAAIVEHDRSHAAEIFIKVCYQWCGGGFFGQRSETDQIREQDCHRHPRATERAVVTSRIFENFFDQIFRNVAFERAPCAQFLQTLERIFEAERK